MDSVPAPTRSNWPRTLRNGLVAALVAIALFALVGFLICPRRGEGRSSRRSPRRSSAGRRRCAGWNSIRSRCVRGSSTSQWPIASRSGPVPVRNARRRSFARVAVEARAGVRRGPAVASAGRPRSQRRWPLQHRRPDRAHREGAGRAAGALLDQQHRGRRRYGGARRSPAQPESRRFQDRDRHSVPVELSVRRADPRDAAIRRRDRRRAHSR